jgi:ferritin-like protein
MLMQNENNKTEENIINVIGVKVLEQNGINIDEIIKLLVYNASVEFAAYYYFTNLRMHCTGQEGESIKGVIEDARLEDLSHFESSLSRIYELGGILPIDAQEFIRMSGCEFLQLPSPKRTDLKEILKKCLKAEQGAIVNWNRLCNLTIGKDPATYDVAKDILKEIEHESWFLELLYERPSGHMRRKYPGERPHTHKHSRSLNI